MHVLSCAKLTRSNVAAAWERRNKNSSLNRPRLLRLSVIPGGINHRAGPSEAAERTLSGSDLANIARFRRQSQQEAETPGRSPPTIVGVQFCSRPETGNIRLLTLSQTSRFLM